MRELAGRVAVVTGGASGVGRALCAALAREGMEVCAADVEKAALDRCVSELRALGLRIEGIVTDVLRPESVEALAAEVFARHRTVHLLFNNAGVGLGEARRRIWTLPDEDWRWGFGVNVFGVVNGIRAFVPTMLARSDEGVVVNTSSGNGGLHILPTTPIYSATKAAVTSLTETLHYQFLLDHARLRAAALFPGPHLVNTQILNSSRNRPPELRAVGSAPAGYVDMQELAKSSGVAFRLTEPDQVAAFAIEGIRAGRYWLLPESAEQDARVRTRWDGMLARRNPELPAA